MNNPCKLIIFFYFFTTCLLVYNPINAFTGLPFISNRLIELRQARNWAYQIQYQLFDWDQQITTLVKGAYDVVVIEPQRTVIGDEHFTTAQYVDQLKNSQGSRPNSHKIVLAYIDIGEAEDYRTYWQDSWIAPTATTHGSPDFLITIDPDGWSGNYPVAFWDPRWQEIIVTSSTSLINLAIDDGFDGIYMDWVEAYSNEQVIQAAETAGINPENAMIEFIALIREVARQWDPEFLIVPQNAPELGLDRFDYLESCDAIGQEDVFFSGGGDTQWDDPGSGDERTPNEGEEWSREWFYDQLLTWQYANKPVFQCSYALNPQNIEEAYSLGAEKGYRMFVSQTPLDRLPVYRQPLHWPEDGFRDDGAIHIYSPRPFIGETASAQQPIFSYDGAYILFVVYKNGFDSGPATLWVMERDGSNSYPVNEEYHWDNISFAHHCWNENNVVVFSAELDGQPHLFFISPFDDEPQPEEIIIPLDNFKDVHASWLNEKLILLERSDGANSDILTVDISTGNSTPIVEGPMIDRHPSFSKESNQIYFERYDPEKGQSDIWSVTLDGSNIKPLTTTPTINESAPTIHGHLLLYTVNQDNLQQFFIHDVTNNTRHSIIGNQNFVDFSPDLHEKNRAIIFHSSRNDTETRLSDIWISEIPNYNAGLYKWKSFDY